MTQYNIYTEHSKCNTIYPYMILHYYCGVSVWMGAAVGTFPQDVEYNV